MIYFIEFNDTLFPYTTLFRSGVVFTFIHIKTTPIRKPETHIIYSLEYHAEHNYNRSIYKPTNKIQSKIEWFFKNDKVFYQDNNVGDAISNYLKNCKKV